MAERQESFQQLDPVGGYSSRPVTLALTVAIVLLASGATLLNWSAVTDSLVAYLAVAATALATIGVAYWSSPLRAPFWSGGGFAALAVAALAMVLSAAAMWGSPASSFEQWAPAAFGLILVQLSPYRPARELAGVTVLGAIVAGFLVVMHPVTGSLPVPVAVIEAVIPTLALGFGATAYSATLVKSVGRWYSRLSPDERALRLAARETIARSVHQDRVGILNDTVVPFLTALLERGTITQSDRDEARAIAQNIRSVMVADVDRSWLDAVVDSVATERGDGHAPGSEVVEDPDRLAAEMTTEQRIVTRAVIVALFGHPGFDPDGFAILIERAPKSAVLNLVAKLDLDESIPRSGLAAHFAILRIAFGDLSVSFQRPTLTLRFSYGNR